MSNNLVSDRRTPAAKTRSKRRRDYTMLDFRAEMQRRGVSRRPPPRLLTPDDRAVRRAKYQATKLVIPTGEPRFGESSRDRAARIESETTRAFYRSIVDAAVSRLALLEGRGGHHLVDCPWARVEPCTAACRCGGTGKVSIKALRAHYTRMVEEYGGLA